MEFVRVTRFAEFKKKLGASRVLASLIRRAIEKFNFKRSQLEGRENFIFRTFLEVTNRLPQNYLSFSRLVIISFKLRSLSMATLFARTKRNMSCANPKANHFQFPKG